MPSWPSSLAPAAKGMRACGSLRDSQWAASSFIYGCGVAAGLQRAAWLKPQGTHMPSSQAPLKQVQAHRCSHVRRARLHCRQVHRGRSVGRKQDSAAGQAQHGRRSVLTPAHGGVVIQQATGPGPGGTQLPELVPPRHWLGFGGEAQLLPCQAPPQLPLVIPPCREGRHRGSRQCGGGVGGWGGGVRIQAPGSPGSGCSWGVLLGCWLAGARKQLHLHTTAVATAGLRLSALIHAPSSSPMGPAPTHPSTAPFCLPVPKAPGRRCAAAPL